MIEGKIDLGALERQAGRAEGVHTGEEKATGRPQSNFQCLKGLLDKGLGCQDREEWLPTDQRVFTFILLGRNSSL